MKRKSFTLVLAAVIFCMILTSPVLETRAFAANPTFTNECKDGSDCIDIPDEPVPVAPLAPPLNVPSQWARAYINRAAMLELAPYEPETGYQDTVTREIFCGLAVKLYERFTDEEITVTKDFTDTDNIDIRKMAGLGVVQGVGGGKFNPGGILNREQAAVVIANLLKQAGYPLKTSGNKPVDANEISDWAAAQVDMVRTTGIMTGVGNGRFAPKGEYSYEQCVVSILQAFDYLNMASTY